jgi:hypothetical protein
MMFGDRKCSYLYQMAKDFSEDAAIDADLYNGM